MPVKDNLKSARKLFMVMRTKQTIFGLLEVPNEEVSAKLEELNASLSKVFGEKEAIEIIEEAIGAAGGQFDQSIQNLIAETVAEQKDSD